MGDIPRCCGGNSCACLIQSSTSQVTVSGSGSASDPYVISGAVNLSVADNSVFDLQLSGAGSDSSPWILGLDFASTASINDLPDVQILSPSNGQVLGWDSSIQQWTPRAPTTAASGSVTTDTGLTGDGSGGSPLGVNEDPDGYLATGAAGLGLSTLGKNRIVRHHADSATRALATPSPDLNALTMLDSVPGRIDYWTGVAWAEYGQYTPDYGTSQLLSMSGAYSSDLKLRMVVRQVVTTTDDDGYFDILTAADLAGRAGVLGCWFQPTLSSVFHTVVEPSSNTIRGRAYSLLDGDIHQSQNVSGVALALVY